MTQRLSRATLMKAKSPRHRASVRPLLEALEGRLVPAAYTVNSTADLGTGSGLKGDLRYCLTQADLLPSSTITFDSTMFATPQTVTLNGTELPVLTANIKILGPAPA